jgi:hypothetical protein
VALRTSLDSAEDDKRTARKAEAGDTPERRGAFPISNLERIPQMSLASFLKSKFTALDADTEAVFLAIEPELQTLAKAQGAKLLLDLSSELPKLEPMLTAELGMIAGLPPGVGPAIAAAIVGSASTWLATALAKVAPPVPVTPTPPPAATTTAPLSTTAPTKATP